MTDKPIFADEHSDELEDGADTLIVPPPNFQERLEAAQRARSNEAHRAVEIPNPLAKPCCPAKPEEPPHKDEKRES